MSATNILFVPSHEVDPIDSLSSTHTLSRLWRAAQLWHKHSYGYIVVSGGTIWPRTIQTQPLARTMANYLLNSAAIPLNRLVIEDRSHDTWENVSMTCHKLLDLGVSPQDVHWTIVTEKEQGRRIRVILEQGYRIRNLTIIHPGKKVPWRRRILEYLMYLLTLYDPRGTSLIPRLVRARRSRFDPT